MVKDIWHGARVEGTASFRVASKLKKWVRDEENKLEDELTKGLEEIEDIDRLEGKGKIMEMDREKREVLRREVAYKMNLEVI